MSFPRHGQSFDPMSDGTQHDAELSSIHRVHRKTPRAGVRTYSRRSSASMSCSWLFLGGLLCSRARLRFTNWRTACDTFALPVEDFAANGKQCLIRLSQPRGPLQTKRL